MTPAPATRDRSSGDATLIFRDEYVPGGDHKYAYVAGGDSVPRRSALDEELFETVSTFLEDHALEHRIQRRKADGKLFDYVAYVGEKTAREVERRMLIQEGEARTCLWLTSITVHSDDSVTIHSHDRYWTLEMQRKHQDVLRAAFVRKDAGPGTTFRSTEPFAMMRGTTFDMVVTEYEVPAGDGFVWMPVRNPQRLGDYVGT